jgi:indole-3-glycerol phosphate synthase
MPASAFVDALLASPLPLVMEVKRRDGHDVDLMGSRTTADVVSAYVQAGAPCISVVTGRWFGGDDDLLREVAALTDLPLLKKDFITRERQIVAAKEMGAAALLLTARILPKSAFQALIETILAHDLTPFVEVADPEELASVIHPERCIIAINNKDIRHQERDGGEIDVSRSLLAATIATGTPCPVSASAITDPEVAAGLVHDGFKGLLIGTGLLQADSVAGWVQQFTEHRSALYAAQTEPPTGAQAEAHPDESRARSSVR